MRDYLTLITALLISTSMSMAVGISDLAQPNIVSTNVQLPEEKNQEQTLLQQFMSQIMPGDVVAIHNTINEDMLGILRDGKLIANVQLSAFGLIDVTSLQMNTDKTLYLIGDNQQGQKSIVTVNKDHVSAPQPMD